MSEKDDLLKMFIKDGYSASGKISKKTALAMMKYVEKNDDLQRAVNNSNWQELKKINLSEEQK